MKLSQCQSYFTSGCEWMYTLQFSYFLKDLCQIRRVSRHDAIYECGVAFKKVELLVLYILSRHYCTVFKEENGVLSVLAICFVRFWNFVRISYIFFSILIIFYIEYLSARRMRNCELICDWCSGIYTLLKNLENWGVFVYTFIWFWQNTVQKIFIKCCFQLRRIRQGNTRTWCLLCPFWVKEGGNIGKLDETSGWWDSWFVLLLLFY